MRPRFLGTRHHPRIVGGSGSTQRFRAAKSRARADGKGLYRIDLASVISKYVGQTERNIRRVLDEAERANAVLYFDEADQLFERRSDDGPDRAAAAKSYLISTARRRRMLLVTGKAAVPGPRKPGAASESDDD